MFLNYKQFVEIVFQPSNSIRINIDWARKYKTERWVLRFFLFFSSLVLVVVVVVEKTREKTDKVGNKLVTHQIGRQKEKYHRVTLVAA